FDPVLQRRGGRGVAEAHAGAVPQGGLAQSRAGGDLALPPVDRHTQGNHGRTHVSHHHPGTGARDARPRQIGPAMQRITVVGLLVAFALSLDAAAARYGKRQLWGSIAYSTKTCAYGYAVDRKTKREAE